MDTMEAPKRHNACVWEKMGRFMLRKVAIAQAFRLAFPDELGGMPYTADELPEHMTESKPETKPALPDVTPAALKNDKGEIVPKSTIQFESPIPKGIAVIPVVYVENDCLQEPNDLSERIINRVYTMAQTHDISINEIQVDCDWTKSTMHDCFLLLNNMRLQLKSINNCKLSATIRMHQLAMPAPPVDYGVLMCYNTGDLHDYHTDNAILSEKDIRPYLNCLKKYELPICGAYPVFGWKLLFEGGQFRAILRSVDLSDAALYKKISDRKY